MIFFFLKNHFLIFSLYIYLSRNLIETDLYIWSLKVSFIYLFFFVLYFTIVFDAITSHDLLIMIVNSFISLEEIFDRKLMEFRI